MFNAFFISSVHEVKDEILWELSIIISFFVQLLARLWGLGRVSLIIQCTKMADFTQALSFVSVKFRVCQNKCIFVLYLMFFFHL